MSNRGVPRIFCRHRAVREDELDGVLFLIDEEEKSIHALEPLGRAIWLLLLEPTATGEIVALLSEAFPGVPRGRIAADVRRLLSDLEDSNLLSAQ